MKPEIHRLPLGLTNCYLIKAEGLVLVEGGFPNKAEEFVKHLSDLCIEPKDIRLLVATHGHWDHVGSVSEIKALTGCEVAINQREKDWLEQGLVRLPPGITLWGKIFAAMLRMYAPLVTLPPAAVDLALDDSDFSLEPYGIPGNVVYTPGHTSGSMSLLLDSGDAFVGCMAMSGLPFRFGPGMPIFAEDIGALRQSWRLLLSRGAKWIHPAHGKPFAADVMEKLL